MYEIDKVVVVSTAHVPHDSGKAINRDADGFGSGNGFPDATFRGEYGWIVVLPEDDSTSEVSLRANGQEWLIPIVAFARTVGAGYVRFDSDGEVIELLPVFEELDAPAEVAA